MASNPDIIAYADGISVFQPLKALGHIEWMPGGIKSAIGADKYIVPETHFGCVKNNAVDIGKKVLANLYILYP
jgi:hypothetical protein